MSRGFPSMTALLGLLAIAGYQNRDKIAEVISGLGKGAPAPGGLGGSLVISARPVRAGCSVAD